jgi:hypothetical protein
VPHFNAAPARDGVPDGRLAGTKDQMAHQILGHDRRGRLRIHDNDVCRSAGRQLAQQRLVKESPRHLHVVEQQLGQGRGSGVGMPSAVNQKRRAQSAQHRRRHAVGAEPNQAALLGRVRGVELTDAVARVRFRIMHQHGAVQSDVGILGGFQVDAVGQQATLIEQTKALQAAHRTETKCPARFFHIQRGFGGMDVAARSRRPALRDFRKG